MVSGVKKVVKAVKVKGISKIEQAMATEQIMSEVIAKAVAEATRVAIQAISETQME